MNTEQQEQIPQALYSIEDLKKYGLKAENLLEFRVEGDSMDGVLPGGSWALTDRSRTAIQDGRAYVLRRGEDMQVKYLLQRPDGGVIIRSHNPKYQDVVVAASELEHVEVIGEVVGSRRTWIEP